MAGIPPYVLILERDHEITGNRESSAANAETAVKSDGINATGHFENVDKELKDEKLCYDESNVNVLDQDMANADEMPTGHTEASESLTGLSLYDIDIQESLSKQTDEKNIKHDLNIEHVTTISEENYIKQESNINAGNEH